MNPCAKRQFSHGLPQPADQLPSAQPNPDPAMFMRAQVLNRQGEPFVEAEVDIWHSSSVRLYENRDPIQESMNQRGKFTTDDDGRFWFQLVKPTGYPIPTHGVVGKLLAVQSRHPFRPAHVHALIFKEGYKTLISEVYADDAPNLETDLAFGVTQVLVARFERHDEPPPTEPNAGTPWYSLDYTFVMEPGVATLPRPLIKWSRLYWTQAYTFEGERLITLWLLPPARLSKHPLRAVTDQVDPDHLGLCRSCHQHFSAVHLCTSQIMNRPTGFLRNGTS